MKKNALLIAAISGLLTVTSCGNKTPTSTPAKAEKKSCTCSEAKTAGTDAKKECTCGANGCGANGCGSATTQETSTPAKK